MRDAITGTPLARPSSTVRPKPSTGLQHPPVARDLRHRARGEREGQVYGDRYFEKVEDREPDWNFYRRF
jgi:hypothetical protein